MLSFCTIICRLLLFLSPYAFLCSSLLVSVLLVPTITASVVPLPCPSVCMEDISVCCVYLTASAISTLFHTHTHTHTHIHTQLPIYYSLFLSGLLSLLSVISTLFHKYTHNFQSITLSFFLAYFLSSQLSVPCSTHTHTTFNLLLSLSFWLTFSPLSY